MSTFRITLLTSVVLVVVLLNIARIEVAANECNNNSECLKRYGSSFKNCCRARYTYSGSRVCQTNCVGHSCISSTDCASGECCDSNDECSEDCFTGLAGGIIAAIIIGTIILIAIPVAIIVCCCCCGAAAASASRRPVNRGVILSQPGGMTVVTSQNAQSIQTGPGYPTASYPSAPSYPGGPSYPSAPSYPGAPVYSAPLQNPAPYNPYPQKPGQDLPPQQAQGPPPAYSAQ